jgi:transcriptional regulator with XRE-family HTH domain
VVGVNTYMIQGLPERLRELRMNRGLSQRSVARHLEVSPSIISSYETGERTPSTENLLSLSYLYHCSTDYLLGRESLPKKTLIHAEGLSPKQIALLQELVETMRRP